MRTAIIAAALAVLPVLPAILAAPGAAGAQEEADTITVEELERRIETLSRELEEMRLGQGVVAEADTSVLGFGPAASKVYRVQQGVSIGGYGEVVYENFDDTREDGLPSGVPNQVDALRAIVYVGYKFNDQILFNSEIEFEHGSTGQAGSASMEFAYVDYLLNDDMGLRAGLLLSPMGFINELHEPPIFLGTTRPLTESRIIPTTWRENGIGVFGASGDFDYRLYVMNGLDGVGGGTSNAGGFSAAGLRGGRQKGSRAMAEGLALAGRLDWTGELGALVGTSLYLGNSGHGRVVDGETVEARTTILDLHAEYRVRGLDLRGLLAVANVDEVAELNELRGLDGDESVGERLVGGYLQAGYDVLRDTDSDHQLVPFLRLERLNTQAEVPEGFAADPANEVTAVTVGASWKPIPSVVGKVDYQIHQTEADTGVNQFNLALGYLF